jgi:hypothetical protein
MYQAKPKHLLICSVALLMLAACSPDYARLATFDPQHVSCFDRSTPEILQKAEYDFGQMAESAPNIDERHIPERTRKLMYQSLQSSRKLANSGNVIGMEIFGDMMEHELVITYLDEKHIFFSKEAAAVSLPESMRGNIVAALSYIYTAMATKGDPGDRAQKTIDRIRNPAAVDGSSAPDYVRIPDSWFEEAQANAERWKDYCGKK